MNVGHVLTSTSSGQIHEDKPFSWIRLAVLHFVQAKTKILFLCPIHHLLFFFRTYIKSVNTLMSKIIHA